VGHNCLQDSRELAAHARQVGAVAVATLSPSYFKPADVESLVDWCAQVAEQAPELPFYFYDIPAWTGVHLSMFDFLKIGGNKIPNLAGIKYTNTDLATLQRCLRFEDGRFDILFGCDESLLAGLSLGCQGAVGSSYNFAAPIYWGVINAYNEGDSKSARLWQERSTEMISVIARFCYMGAAKAVMRMVGVNCGPVRLPLRSPDSEALKRLEKELGQIGFFDWIGQN